MSYAGMWPPVTTGEEISYSINFAPRLSAGDTISDEVAPVVAISVEYGTDDEAAALLAGDPVVDETYTLISQKAGPGWVPGVTYRLTATVQTQNGETLICWGSVRCDPIAANSP